MNRVRCPETVNLTQIATHVTFVTWGGVMTHHVMPMDATVLAVTTSHATKGHAMLRGATNQAVTRKGKRSSAFVLLW